MNIVPAILETDIDKFSRQLARLAPHFSRFQIDIADGKFVPNTTVQIRDIRKALKSIKPTLVGKTFDFHLMVEDYESEVQKLTEVSDNFSIGSVLIHVSTLRSKFNIQDSTLKAGLVLNPENEVAPHWERLRSSPAVQIMTVHPGFQGAAFLPEQLNKIDQLRERGYKGEILLDGGINERSIPTIISRTNVPDVLGMGSYISMAKDVGARINQIKITIPQAHF